MRAVFLMSTAVFVLSGCQDGGGNSDAGQPPEELQVCSDLSGQIAELQKDVAREVVVTLTRQEWEQREGRSKRNEIEDRFDLHLNSVLALMIGHGCEMPTQVPETYDYLEPAIACEDARTAEAENTDQICDRESWEPQPIRGRTTNQ